MILYGQKSVLTKSINIIILPNKKFLKRDTGNFDEKQENKVLLANLGNEVCWCMLLPCGTKKW